MERHVKGKLQKLALKVECSKPGVAQTTGWTIPSSCMMGSCLALSGGRSKRTQSKRLPQPK